MSSKQGSKWEIIHSHFFGMCRVGGFGVRRVRARTNRAACKDYGRSYVIVDYDQGDRGACLFGVFGIYKAFDIGSYIVFPVSKL